MKKIFFIIIFIFVFSFALLPSFSFAQGMMGNTATVSDGHTVHEEAEGKAVWEKLQAKKLNCEDLSDDDFGALGEYFMGQMAGEQHEIMNNMMIRMMGEEGEEQMHVAMGKRMSDCEPDAAIPQDMMNSGMMQMMMGSGMMGNWSNSSTLKNNFTTPMSMMNFGFMPFGGFGWIFMILWWVLIIAGIVALIKWLTSQSRGTHNHEKSALEVLKERYAKGEIDKKEFEEKKKDLS